MYPIGLDIGNGAIKLVGPSEVRVLLPHALAPTTEFSRDVTMVTGEPLNQIHAEVWSPSLGARTVVAGDLAAREYPQYSAEATEGEEKATSDRHLILALLSMAAAVQRADLHGSVRMSVTTALPVAEVTRSDARRALADRLKGYHRIRWGAVPTWSGQSVDLLVDDVDIIPEGAAAYLSVSDANPALVNGTTLVVDIGARSIDWVAFLDGQYAQGLSGGACDGGLAIAADRILAAARQQHGPHVGRHRQDVLDALRSPTGTGTDQRIVVFGRGREYDVTTVAQRELAALAIDVGRLASQALGRVGRVDNMVLVGGGGLLLAPYLTRQTEMPWMVPDDPVWANAQGLFLRAERRVRRAS